MFMITTSENRSSNAGLGDLSQPPNLTNLIYISKTLLGFGNRPLFHRILYPPSLSLAREPCIAIH